MPKTNAKQKGNRFEKTDYHIPYYTTAFFNPGRDTKDDEEDKKSPHMVKLPIKISADGDDSRANVTNFEMRGISHFDNNVEPVLESLSQLKERVVKPKGIEDPNEEWKTTLQLLQIICDSGPASQTLQEAARVARTHVYETYFDDDDMVQEEIVTSDENAFYELLDAGFKAADVPNDIDGVDDSDDYVAYLYSAHKRSFWNHLHSIIFGADAYRAYKQQRDYLLHKIVKPFGVGVEAAFRRIEVLARYMEYFPPPCGRGKQATQDQWDSHEETKKIATEVKKEMKYNLLPEAYHDRFDGLENDWSEMSSSKFLSEAQKFEGLEAKERLKGEKKKEAMKRRVKEDESQSSLSRAQRDKNAQGKRRKTQQETTNAGKQRLCQLCKAAGAPEFVYLTHHTSQCKKKDEYARRLSGDAASRSNATKDLRNRDNYKKREAKLMNKIKRLQKKVKKTNKDDDSSISSVSSSGTNVSFWVNNITFHGGDTSVADDMSIDDVPTNTNKIKTKINHTHEMNVLDKLISTDCTSTNTLLNDFHKNEMKNNS